MIKDTERSLGRACPILSVRRNSARREASHQQPIAPNFLQRVKAQQTEHAVRVAEIKAFSDGGPARDANVIRTNHGFWPKLCAHGPASDYSLSACAEDFLAVL